MPFYNFTRITSESFFAVIIYVFALKTLPVFYHNLFFVFIFIKIIFLLVIISTSAFRPIFDANVLFIRFSTCLLFIVEILVFIEPFFAKVFALKVTLVVLTYRVIFINLFVASFQQDGS